MAMVQLPYVEYEISLFSTDKGNKYPSKPKPSKHNSSETHMHPAQTTKKLSEDPPIARRLPNAGSGKFKWYLQGNYCNM